ncbi:MAG: hypothetical protein Q7S87_10225 [Agitococcus sp.]|nr:hypothetical protein [Agitococcus sp.]MDO9179296.1 hypothetical protein [Agitococcus sp.]
MDIRFFNIKWDTDGETVELPQEVTVTVEEDVDIPLSGADILSDKYEFCVISFSFETLRNPHFL